MRIVDARSGQDVRIGQWVTYPPPSAGALFYDGPPGTTADGIPDLTPEWRCPGRWRATPNQNSGVELSGHGLVDPDSYRILEVRDGFTTADARYETANGRIAWGSLRVRFMHPGFMFQRVAFVPS